MKYYLKVWQNCFDFDGRARRSEYWYFFLFNVLFSVGLTALSNAMRIPEISILYSFAIIIPAVAVGIRRMHDVGKSGWYILFPIYNFILACTAGDKGENEYGQDPKAEEENQFS